jgi:hypothetical protein
VLFLTEIDGVCETPSAKASVALDDNAIRSQKYTSIGRFQLFLNVFVPLAPPAARTQPAGNPKGNTARLAGVRARAEEVTE